MVKQRFGSEKPRGFVNPVKVTCSKCKTKQNVKPGSGQWVCHSCGHKNGAK